MKRDALLLAALIATLNSSSFAADDEAARWWPQFRGPSALGIAQPGAYPVKFDANTNVIWKTELPFGLSSPCVWENHIFLTAHDKQRTALETICLDRKSGKILWRKDAPAESIEKVHEVSSPANATPACDGQRVYVYFASYGLTAYDFAGQVVWTKALPLMPSAFGSGSSPIVAQGLVLLNRDGFGPRTRPNAADAPKDPNAPKPQMLAFDAKTGQVVWEMDRPSSFARYPTPVIWRHESEVQVLTLASGRLTSYDLATGQESWWIGDLPRQVCATPQVIGAHVYLTGTSAYGEPENFELPSFEEMVKKHDKDGDGLLSRDEIPPTQLVVNRRAANGAGDSLLNGFTRGMDRNQDGKFDQQEWNGFSENFGGFMTGSENGVIALKPTGQGEITQQSLVWRNKRGFTEVPSPLVLGEYMFLVRNGGIVHKRNIASGEDVYQGRLGAEGGYYASPVAADGKVYFASDLGVVTVIDAQAPKLTVLAQNDLRESVMATPALVDGFVYLRTDRHLFALGQQ